jgi:hypothetical protein
MRIVLLLCLGLPGVAQAQARLGAEVGAPYFLGARVEGSVSRVRLGALFLGFPKLTIRHFIGAELAWLVVNGDDGQVYVGGAIGRGLCTTTETNSCDFKSDRSVAAVLGGVEMPLGSKRYTLGVEFGNWFDLGKDADDFSRRSMALIFRYTLPAVN